MGAFTESLQKLYVAYFNRPADPGGLAYWENALTAGATTVDAISASFASSAEYKAAYEGKTPEQVVDTVYMNLFGRGAEAGGLLFWGQALRTGKVTVANVVTSVAAGAQGTDAEAFAAKVAVATGFTNALDLGSEIVAYNGTKANDAAKALIATVKDAASKDAALANLDATISKIETGRAEETGKTYKLTAGADSFTGNSGNDVFVASYESGTNNTLTSYDALDGGAGNDTLSVNVGGAAALTIPGTAKVSNIEIANLSAENTVTADTTTWTGLTTLTVDARSIPAATDKSGNTTSITAAATTSVVLNDSNNGGVDVTIEGGKDVTATIKGMSGTDVNIGGATAPVGIVSVNTIATAAVGAGTINVNGGTTVNVTQSVSGVKVNSTTTNASVNVTGTATTTAVTLKAAAAATQSATKVGVTASAVSITDVNSGGASTKAGTITSISVDSYTTVGIANNALTTLSLANGSGNVIIDNSSSLATVTNKTLALTVNGLTGGTLDDADVYTKLNITATGAASKLANITTGKVEDITLGGSKGLTLTSAAGLTALKTVTVSGSAGITADLSGAKVTTVDTSATTGTSKVTIDAANATFTGGAGADSVTVAATAPTKAISLGAGDDSLDISNATASPTKTLDGGAGSDSLTVTAANAATASADSKFAGIVQNFEKLVLTGSTNQTVDLAVLGNFNHVTTSGGNGLTLNGMTTGGTLVLNGNGTAYTVANSAFTAGKTDVLNLSLTSAGQANFASTGITAANVETIAITVADTQDTPTGTFNDSVTLLGNSVAAITVSGNAGLALTAASTALTNVDASGISLAEGATGGFTFTAGALAAAATIKGSVNGVNDVTASAATKAVTYTGGSLADKFTSTNAQNNSAALGEGNNIYDGTGANGNNTITAGAGNDTVTVGNGNNTVTLGDGANTFTAGSGANTYTGGKGVDTVTVGGGKNVITLGAGNDIVTISAASSSANSYSEIKDAHKGVTINLIDRGTEVFNSTKVELADTAVLQDYANQVVQQGGNASVNGKMGWFQFQGNTYIVESLHDGSGNNASFVNGTDVIIRLTGLIDLSTANFSGNSLTLG